MASRLRNMLNILGISICLFLQMGNSFAQAKSNLFTPQNFVGTMENRIYSAFSAANSSDSSAAQSAMNIDFNVWLQSIETLTSATGDLGIEVRAALLAHYVKAWNSFLRLPTEVKNSELNTIWAKIFLSQEKRDEILNMPLVFSVISVRESSNFKKVKIQIWPELTGNDSSGQVTFVVSGFPGNWKVVDIISDGLPFLATWTGGLTGYRKYPRELINLLLSKKLITTQDIEDFKPYVR